MDARARNFLILIFKIIFKIIFKKNLDWFLKILFFSTVWRLCPQYAKKHTFLKSDYNVRNEVIWNTACIRITYTNININALFLKREEADDVLIIKNGLVTDASYSNILFFDGKQIVTPSTPLLEGTCRARLLATNRIVEKSISVDELQNFESFQLVNALNDFDESRWIPIQNIKKD